MPEPARLLRDPAFQRAFIAVSYFAGTRGDGLLLPLSAPTAEAKKLVQGLGSSEKSVRAVVLGRELERIARGLDAWRLR
jgi:hypothetical protein